MQSAELNAEATRRRARNAGAISWRRCIDMGVNAGKPGVYREEVNEVDISAHIGACAVWSGREDLNLRPLRPERSALPGCATPRPGRTENEFRIVLQEGGKTQAVRFCHASTGHFAVHHIHTHGKAGVRSNGSLHPFRRKTDNIRECGVGQGQSRGMGNDARHIRHTVMEYSVHDVHGIRVSGRPVCFSASALFHGDIHDHRTRLHFGHHVAGNDSRGARPRH